MQCESGDITSRLHVVVLKSTTRDILNLGCFVDIYHIRNFVTPHGGEGCKLCVTPYCHMIVLTSWSMPYGITDVECQ